MSGPTPPARRPSELERMLDRLATQRACIEHAAALVADVPGPVLELGLGKGRTYDHLRRVLGGRELFAFDRTLHAPAHCMPDAGRLVLGELAHTLVHARAWLPAPAALVHADLGTADPAADARLMHAIAPLIDALLRPGAVVLADRAMRVPRWGALAAPPGARWPYHLYRVRERR